MESWKLTPVAQQKLLQISDFQLRVQRLHGMVEQYATAKVNASLHEAPIRRAAEHLKITLIGAGYAQLAQVAASIAMALRRGGSAAGKARALREGVGTLRAQLDTEQRIVAAEGRVRASPEPGPE